MREGRVVGGFGAKVYLSVIGIAVEFQVEVAENLSRGRNAEGTFHGTVRNGKGQRGRGLGQGGRTPAGRVGGGEGSR